jgi:hypothetical protein
VPELSKVQISTTWLIDLRGARIEAGIAMSAGGIRGCNMRKRWLICRDASLIITLLMIVPEFDAVEFLE